MTGASPTDGSDRANPEMFRGEHVFAETSRGVTAAAQTHPRAGALWTGFEELQLTQRRAIGQSYAEIAETLGRPERAVRVHACKIGVAKRNDRTRALNARRAAKAKTR
jgi:hypothetical protein